MKLTLSQILKDATDKYLWDGTPKTALSEKQTYICFALNEWSVANPGYDEEIEELQTRIHVRIEGYITVYAWLLAKLGESVHSMTTIDIQTKRKELVNDLIAELEKEGN